MELICDLSREGNDCWIKEKWYWCKDFGDLIISIYDDGYEQCTSKFNGIDHSNVPKEVKTAFIALTEK